MLMNKHRILLTGLMSVLVFASTVSAGLDRLPIRRMLIIDNWNYSEDVLGKLSESRFTEDKVQNLEKIFNASVNVFAQGGPNYTIGKTDVLTKISAFLDAFDDREESIAYIYLHAHGGKYGPTGEEQACLYSEATHLEKDGSFTPGETILEEEIARVIENGKNANSRLKVFLFVDACSQAKTEKKKTMSDRQFRWSAVAQQSAEKRRLTYRDVTDLVMFAGLGSVKEEDNIYSQLMDRYQSGHLKQRLSVEDFKRASKSDFVIYGTHNSDAIFRETQSVVAFNDFTPGATVQQSTLPIFLHQPNVIPAASYSFTIREERGNFYQDYYLRRRLDPGLNYLFTPDSCQQMKGNILLNFPGDASFQDGAILTFTLDGDKYNAAYRADQGGFVCQLLPGEYGSLNYKDQIVTQHFTVSSNATQSFELKTPVKQKDIYVPTAVELNFLKKTQYDYITRLFFPNQLIVDNDGFLYNERQVQYFEGDAGGKFFTTLKYAKGRLYGLEDRWISISGADSTSVIAFPEAIKDFVVLENGDGLALSGENNLFEFTHAGRVTQADLNLEGSARQILLIGDLVIIVVRDDYNRYDAYRYAYQEGKLDKHRLEGVVEAAFPLNKPYVALQYRDHIRIIDVNDWRELPLIPALSQRPYFLYHQDRALFTDFNGQLFEVTVQDSVPVQQLIISKFPKAVVPSNTVVFGRALITLKSSRTGSSIEVLSDEGKAEYELNDPVNRMYLYGQQVYFTGDKVLLTYAIAERQAN